MKQRIAKPKVPKELDADVAMSVILSNLNAVLGDDLFCKYDFKGVSERTALGDDLKLELKKRQNSKSLLKVTLKRDSIYHILPEFLFHPLDRYLGIEEDTEEFDKRYKEQEEQEKNALDYFKPFDQIFQELRTHYQQWLNENIFSGNQFVSDFITSGYYIDFQNPYIKAVYPCIAWLRDHRGSDGMVETALGCAFQGKADITKVFEEQSNEMSGQIHASVDGTIDDLFCGPSFYSEVCIWKVYYHTKIETSNHLQTLKRQINEFSEFFAMWFLPLESALQIDFGDKYAKPELSSVQDEHGVFLNYSTQLI